MSFKFTIIKKNQILAGAVTLMLVTAGYLNYKYDPIRPYEVEVTGIIEENLGDAVLVDSNGIIQDFGGDLVNSSDYILSNDGTTPVFQNNTSLSDINKNVSGSNLEKEVIKQNEKENIKNNVSNKALNEKESNNEQKTKKFFKDIEDYFVSTRIDRTNNYAEQIESYENILDGANTTEEQKNKAQEQIEHINSIRNSIMIAENLIKLKGFDETVILVNENSINVIVAADNLTSSEVAQLQSVIVNEFSVDISKVHIINYD